MIRLSSGRFVGLAALVAVSMTGAVKAAPIAFTQFGPAPAPSIQVAGGWDGGYVNLTQEVNSLNNQAAFPQVVAGVYQSLTVDFDFRISPGISGGADGIGFVYADSTAHGVSGPTPSFSEEANLTGSFGVGFDTFNNADLGDGGENSVSVHYNGVALASVPIDATAISSFETNVVNHAKIEVIPVGGGAELTVTVTDGANTIVPFNDYFVAGLAPYDGRMVFNARTGGANSVQDIDNVQVVHWAGGNEPKTTVLYTFVPEPSTLALAGLAVGVLALVRRRRSMI